MAVVRYITGQENGTSATNRSQVYQATHKGEKRLPFMNRSFISFTYGGKSIEDFNLIATTDGDRMSRNGYASFEDLTTTYDVLPGQFYWGTHYKTNSMTFKLSTDSMTQRQLDDFVYWFSAGAVRELILAEHPNRAIMARIANPPSISVLPFEKKITVKLGDESYNTSTTEYKGEITLELVMDEPHWYSKINIFGFPDENSIYHDEWTDANGETRSVFDDPDAIKIAYEDGIPFSSMIQSSMLLGDDTYANVDYQDCSRVATMQYDLTQRQLQDIWEAAYNEAIESHTPEEAKIIADAALSDASPRLETYVKGAVIADDSETGGSPKTIVADETKLIAENTIMQEYWDDTNRRSIEVALVYEQWQYAGTSYTIGLIAGPVMSNGEGIISLAKNTDGSTINNAYFYYAGTAPSPTELHFTLRPAQGDYYISVPNNSFARALSNAPAYNTLTIESETKQQLQFTTCGLYTAYNHAIDILNKIQVGQNWETIREDIRDNVHHYAVRAWANKVIDSLDVTGAVDSNAVSNILSYMSFMFKDKTENNSFLSGDYVFNSKTGKATATLRFRKPTAALIPQGGIATYGEIVEKEEDVGDMLKSNYLIIRDRNMPDEISGNINAWSTQNKKASHRIYHDVETGLSNIMLKYKNMYL